MISPEFFAFTAASEWGRFRLVGTRRGLLAVHWPGMRFRKNCALGECGKAPAEVAKMLARTAEELGEYFAGRVVSFSARLDLGRLSEFSQRVLRACSRIPHGQTVTYGQLAERAGSSGAARAVGRVLAKNPLPIVSPCHRVLKTDGSLGGFSASGGQDLKRRLLSLEGIPLDQVERSAICLCSDA